MPTDLDRARLLCHICGTRQLLPADPAAVGAELARFSALHDHEGLFAVEVVVANTDELPDFGRIPRQRD